VRRLNIGSTPAANIPWRKPRWPGRSIIIHYSVNILLLSYWIGRVATEPESLFRCREVQATSRLPGQSKITPRDKDGNMVSCAHAPPKEAVKSGAENTIGGGPKPLRNLGTAFGVIFRAPLTRLLRSLTDSAEPKSLTVLHDFR